MAKALTASILAEEAPAVRIGAVRAALLICAASLLLAGHYFAAFTVPDTDFFEFRTNALSLMSGQLPENLKRLPFFPLVIGLASLAFSETDPVLPAALFVNVVFGVASLWLTFCVARRLVGSRAAAAVAALTAVNPAMIYCMTQPCLEPVLLATILLTVDLALAGSRWAYVAAALAGLTRYEAMVLGPAVALQEMREIGARRWGAWWRGALSIAGPCLWIALSAQRHAAVNPYVQEALERKGDPLAFVVGMVNVAAAFLPGGVFLRPLLAAAVVLGGLAMLVFGWRRLWLRHRWALIVPASLFFFYTLVHTVFPAYQVRYVLPVLWLIYVSMAAALQGAGERIGRGLRLVGGSAGNRWAARILIALGILLVVHSLLRLTAGPRELLVSWILLAFAAFAIWWPGETTRQWRLAGALISCAVLAFGLRASALFMAEPWVRDNCAQFRALGEWYRANARPGDRLAVTLPWVVEYYSGLPADMLLPTHSLSAKTPEDAVSELRKLGATYVVWDSDYGRRPTTYHAKRFRADLLAQLRAKPPEGLVLVHEIQGPSRKTADVFRIAPP
jgi:hypothetical protein